MHHTFSHSRSPQPQGGSELEGLLFDLPGQLAGRRQHQNAGTERHAPLAGGLGKEGRLPPDLTNVRQCWDQVARGFTTVRDPWPWSAKGDRVRGGAEG